METMKTGTGERRPPRRQPGRATPDKLDFLPLWPSSRLTRWRTGVA